MVLEYFMTRWLSIHSNMVKPAVFGLSESILNFAIPASLSPFPLTVERAGVRGNARNPLIANIIRAVTVVKSEWHWPSSTAGSRTVSVRVPWV